MIEIDADHPIFAREFTIFTGEMSRACALGVDAAFMRRTGLIFYGLSRVGKTYCIRALKSELSKFMPRTYVTQIEVVNRERQASNNIMLQLAIEEQCAAFVKGSVLQRLNATIEKIELRCKERNCNHWVLLLDEFQRLRNYDLYQLADILNVLERRGIKMTVISFAMPEVLRRRDEFRQKDERQIVSRFMSDLIEFHGCRLNDLKTILHAYDVTSEYPVSSGVSFTRGLTPLSYLRGFRLESYCDLFWRVLNAHSLGAYKNNVPLEHVFISLNYILRFCAKNDGVEHALTERQFQDAVKMSRLKEFTMENGDKIE